jgi:hypothetical protein
LPSCHDEQGYVDGAPDGAAPSRIHVEHKVCPVGAQNLGAPFAFNPAGAPSSNVSVRALIDEASKAMSVPTPQVALSPSVDATQYLGLPLWA